MPNYNTRVGNVEIISISDGTFRPHLANVFPKLSDKEFEDYPEFLEPDGMISTNLGAFVLRSEGKIIVIDTGVGPGLPGNIPQDLKNNGIHFEDVSLVAFTHLHPDHVGWSVTDDGALIFPNAKYWVPKGDWDYFTNSDVLKESAHIKKQIIPLQELGVINLIEADMSLTGEIKSIATPGHTPGHTSYVISSQGQKGYILGDIVNFPFQLEKTDWEISFDNDHLLARKTREAILDKIEKEDAVVGAGHFMPPSLGKLRREKRRYWEVLG